MLPKKSQEKEERKKQKEKGEGRKEEGKRGAWMAQSEEHATLDLKHYPHVLTQCCRSFWFLLPQASPRAETVHIHGGYCVMTNDSSLVNGFSSNPEACKMLGFGLTGCPSVFTCWCPAHSFPSEKGRGPISS